jgi:hypothetical protein
MRLQRQSDLLNFRLRLAPLIVPLASICDGGLEMLRAPITTSESWANVVPEAEVVNEIRGRLMFYKEPGPMSICGVDRVRVVDSTSSTLILDVRAKVTGYRPGNRALRITMPSVMLCIDLGHQ